MLSKSTVKWKVGRKISFEEALYNFYFYKNQTFFKANSVIRTKWKQNSFAQDYTAEISDFPQVVFFWRFFIQFFCLFLQNFWKEKVSAYSVTVLCAVLTYASKYVDQILIEKEVTEEFSIKLQTGNLCFTLSHIMEIKQNLGFI